MDRAQGVIEAGECLLVVMPDHQSRDLRRGTGRARQCLAAQQRLKSQATENREPKELSVECQAAKAAVAKRIVDDTSRHPIIPIHLSGIPSPSHQV